MEGTFGHGHTERTPCGETEDFNLSQERDLGWVISLRTQNDIIMTRLWSLTSAPTTVQK